MNSNKKPSVSEAKANFITSIEDLHPIEAATEAHPLLLLGAAVAVGAIAGRSGTKIFKKAILLASPVLLNPSLSYGIFKKLFHIDLSAKR